VQEWYQERTYEEIQSKSKRFQEIPDSVREQFQEIPEQRY
jgi:hypothetical protein